MASPCRVFKHELAESGLGVLELLPISRRGDWASDGAPMSSFPKLNLLKVSRLRRRREMLHLAGPL
eukprot:10073547-Prorocentrum_lima.AAC.1